MEMLRVKNGMWLTMNPAEQIGWTIVVVGRIARAKISEVIITRTVPPLQKTKKILADLAIVSCSNTPPVKKDNLSKRAPGANTKNKTTLRIIRTKSAFRTDLNLFSWSSWVNSVGWKKRDKSQIRKTLPTLDIRNILVMLRLMKEDWTRLTIHIRLIFKAANTRGGGSPKAWTHKLAAHWKCYKSR